MKPVTPEGQMTEALRACRAKFAEYVLHHKREAKNQGRNGWIDAEKARLEKAKANQAMVDLCDAALAATNTVAPEPHAGVSEAMRFEARQTGDTANAMADWELDAIYLAMQRASVASVQDDEP